MSDPSVRMNVSAKLRNRVPRSAMHNAVRAIGLDPADLAELHIFRSHIVAKVYVRDDAGEVVTAADEPVAVDIHIALTADEQGATRE